MTSTWRVRLGVVALLGLYAGLLLSNLPATGLTDDDDFYVPAGRSYAEWLFDLGEPGWLSRGRIDRAFQVNHEHPPLAKYGIGLAGQMFSFLGPIDGPRMFTVAASTGCAGLLLFLCMAHLGTRRGVVAGGLAVLALASMPRFSFHSRVPTLDVPVAAAVLAAAAVALWGERSRWAARLAGIPFGAALATKLNAPFLLVPMFVFWWTTRPWPRPHEPGGGQEGVFRLKPLPTTFFSMVLLGPVVFVALWPWLWFDTWDRLQDYLRFHLNHYPILFYYFQERHDQPFAPWHAPFVMAAITTPLAVLAAAGVGAFAAVPPTFRRLHRRRWAHEPERPEGDLLWFTVLNLFFAVAPVAFSGGPKYGGVKLFLPAFPFVALLAGYGGLRWMEWARSLGVGARRAAAAVGLLALVSAFAYRGAYSHAGVDGAYGLSAYNGLIGGVRGATAWGFERQYYDMAFRDQLAWINEYAPPNARIHFAPNHKEYVRTYRWFRSAGLFRSDLSLTPSRRGAHLVVLTHERRFPSYAADFAALANAPVWTTRWVQGVPMWTVYGGPRAGAGPKALPRNSEIDSIHDAKAQPGG